MLSAFRVGEILNRVPRARRGKQDLAHEHTGETNGLRYFSLAPCTQWVERMDRKVYLNIELVLDYITLDAQMMAHSTKT